MADAVRSRRQIFLIAANQDWLCFWCDYPIDEMTVTRDHLQPKSRGGKNHRKNIVASCFGCNQAKGNQDAPPDEYLAKKRLALTGQDAVKFRSIRPVAALDNVTSQRRTAKNQRRRQRRKERRLQAELNAKVGDVWPVGVAQSG